MEGNMQDARERIAHLLRRFGLGASMQELDELAPLGWGGALDRILDFSPSDDGFPISPWEICFEEGKDEVYLDPFRTSAWWVLRMCCTTRPAREKLTLFWHDHFAVSGAKVEFGPAMVAYLEALRSNGAGPFRTLLGAVAKDPAMLRFLDNDANLKTAPNENFAREVMELFTIGRGNYTEKDLREAARAFTGWANRYLVFEQGGENLQRRAKECIEGGIPMIAFCVSPELHDGGPKTVLGKTGNLDGDDVLDLLAAHAATARSVARKLWEFYATDPAPPAVVERLAKVFTSGGGKIEPVLRAIATSPEFWSPECVGRKVKSPVDFLVAIARQVRLRDFLLPLRKTDAKPTTPLPDAMRTIGAGLTYLMQQQGMLLLFPPDVGGWEWGTAWTTSATMTQRAQLAEVFFNPDDPNSKLAQGIHGLLVLRGQAATSPDFMRGTLAMLDARVPDETRVLMTSTLDKHGGVGVFSDQRRANAAMREAMRLLFSAPEFQMC